LKHQIELLLGHTSSTRIVMSESSDNLLQVREDDHRVEGERDRQIAVAREQAHLVELAHDSIIVRDLENRIKFWNHGAEAKYGWTRDEAIGQLAHDFLKTQFSQPLEEVEEALQRDHYWEGEVNPYAKRWKENRRRQPPRPAVRCGGQTHSHSGNQ
jgi:PAS domain-containing protein